MPDDLLLESNYISRDLSWLAFNRRVFEQAKRKEYSLEERLRFLSIVAKNSDEFFMIRVGSLYNYIDYKRARIDYSGLSLMPFRTRLLSDYQVFTSEQHQFFIDEILPLLSSEAHLRICSYKELSATQQEQAGHYFQRVIYPMLTPMLYDAMHAFPILMNQVLIFAVISEDQRPSQQKLSFIQIPKNIDRFYEIKAKEQNIFVPIESIIAHHMQVLFKNCRIVATSLFRLTRNSDFNLEESEEIEANFLEELKEKLLSRRMGRVVRMEIDASYHTPTIDSLLHRWQIDTYNLVSVPSPALLDMRALTQLLPHISTHKSSMQAHSILPLSLSDKRDTSLLETLKQRDILLHHPYNSFSILTKFIEEAAEDEQVLAIKLTLYRVARYSRIVDALLRAAELGKHVSVLFEVTARFDEEQNLQEAHRLQKAGCYVVYGLGHLKTHAKMLLIVRKEKEMITRYVHTSTGNYNEDTAKSYGDIGLLSTNSFYADDVSELFNVITGHSRPMNYAHVLTAPTEMRQSLMALISQEMQHADSGQSAGIVIKINSLEDKAFMDALYEASKVNVPIELIVRGVCCLRPGRKGLSENIRVRSLVGKYLEHARIFYFHNKGKPKIYIGSSDVMVRSFDKRVEALFQIIDRTLQKEVMHILKANLKDNQNSYLMQEDGTYQPIQSSSSSSSKKRYNLHQAIYNWTPRILSKRVRLVQETLKK